MTLLPTWIDTRWLRRFRQRLVRWYQQYGRMLPWRATDDAYAIWVSEIMLQQTQVATVLPYYARFLQRFESVEALAIADETEILKFWEGLGYYRRARQMHAAARQMVELHKSKFPKTFDEVLALPGIGRYTAGAICSFAYDRPTPIVEANTQRLYARLLRLDKPLTNKDSQSLLWTLAERILPRDNGRTINQAVMELGSLVCQPTPICESCPLMELCPTFADGLQARIPVPKIKTNYEARNEVAIIMTNSRKQYLIRKCGPDEWWSGLWDFPRLAVSTSTDSKSLWSEIEAKAKQIYDLDCRVEKSLFSVRHSVTKFRITLTCYRATIAKHSLYLKNKPTRKLFGQPSRWVSLDELVDIPLSASGRQVVKRLPAKSVF